ncbi:MAG: hypothetical protein QOE94_1541 [Mycobacterium sp.]|nr:hypothetical protein [Mycobacterium sp.]
MRRAAAASGTVRSNLPLIGLPVKGLCSVGLGECICVLRSPRGECCSTTVIRPGDYLVHNLAASASIVTLYVNND